MVLKKNEINGGVVKLWEVIEWCKVTVFGLCRWKLLSREFSQAVHNNLNVAVLSKVAALFSKDLCVCLSDLDTTENITYLNAGILTRCAQDELIPCSV